MSNDLETGKFAFFHLDLERQAPSNPELIKGIRKELGNNVLTIPLVADEFQKRLADSTLLAGIHPDNRSNGGVIVEAVTPSLGRYYADAWNVLETVASPKTGLKGEIITIFTMFEGRDSNPKKHFGGVTALEQYIRDVRTHSYKKISVYAVWDVHDVITLNKLKNVNGRKNIPEVISITAMPLFTDRLQEDGLIDDETFVAAPDFGSITKARQMAQVLGKELIFIKKTRPEPNRVEIEGVYLIKKDGSVEKKNYDFLKGIRVIFFDDMMDTGRTAIEDTSAVKAAGAREVVFCATHPVFSSPEILLHALDERILDYIYTTDSLPNYKKIVDPLNPQVLHPRLRLQSLAKPIAALIKMAADKATDEDYQLVKRCLYNPGPEKKVIEYQFTKGNIAPAFEGYNFYDGITGKLKSGIIYIADLKEK